MRSTQLVRSAAERRGEADLRLVELRYERRSEPASTIRGELSQSSTARTSGWSSERRWEHLTRSEDASIRSTSIEVLHERGAARLIRSLQPQHEHH